MSGEDNKKAPIQYGYAIWQIVNYFVLLMAMTKRPQQTRLLRVETNMVLPLQRTNTKGEATAQLAEHHKQFVCNR